MMAGADAVGSASPAPLVKITQSSSETVTAINSAACGNITDTAENHYYRRFDLAGAYNAAQGFKVSEVVFGVEKATSSDNNIPGNVSVWAIDHGDAFTVANLEAVATAPVNLDSVADGALLKAPLSAMVPAGKDMVLEVEVDASTTGKLFFIGSNASAQTGDSYLRAPSCALNEPATTASIAFPDMHIVLFANGKAQDCIAAETAVDTANAALTAATAAKTKAATGVTTATKSVADANAAVASAKKSVSKAKAKLKKAKKSGNAAKIKKAKKKVKKAKSKAKAADAALASANTALQAANTALTTATTAVTTATAKVTSTTATATTECAQPALPTPRPSTGGGTNAPAAPGFVTAGS